MTTKRHIRKSTAEWMRIDLRNPELDWERAEGIDARTPIALGTPCKGEHVTETSHPKRVANQAMVLYKCKVCQVRLLYVPRQGFSGAYRKATRLPDKSKDEHVASGPPTWDEDLGTLKAYHRELEKWTAANGDEEVKKDESASEADPDIVIAWEAMSKRLEVSRAGVGSSDSSDQSGTASEGVKD